MACTERTINGKRRYGKKEIFKAGAQAVCRANDEYHSAIAKRVMVGSSISWSKEDNEFYQAHFVIVVVFNNNKWFAEFRRKQREKKAK